MNKTRKKKPLFDRTVAWIHLWPSLITGILLLFVCATGTIAVFCDEVINWVNRDALYVNVGPERLSPEDCLARIRKQHPDRTVSYFITYQDPHRSIKTLSFSEEGPMTNTFIDPYTGKILRDDTTFNFFYIVIHLHASLLMHEAGPWIVDIATIVFLVELITGLILWWPAKWTKATKEQSFKIKWGASFKRVNYDLHNVLGFYSCILALVLTVTGLIIAFRPLANGISRSLGGDPSEEWEERLPKLVKGKKTYPLDSLIARGFKQYPQAKEIQVLTYNDAEAGYYNYTIAEKINLITYNHGEEKYADKYTGRPIPVKQAILKNARINDTNMMLHMGSWSGWLGKIVTFICGLICTSLPVTGFLIWWNRRKKRSVKPVRRRPDI